MILQEMLAPILAFKCEHGDFDLLFKIRGNLMVIEVLELDGDKMAMLELNLLKAAYGGKGKADFGDFMNMLSEKILSPAPNV